MQVGGSFSSQASDSDAGYASSPSSSSRLSSRASVCQSSSCTEPSSLVSLISEISCTDSDSLEQLERENAHFSISESLIQVFEEMRWASMQAPAPEGSQRPFSPPPSSAATVEACDPSCSRPHDNCTQWIRIRGRFPSSEEDDVLVRSLSRSSLSGSEADPQNQTVASIVEPLDRLDDKSLLPGMRSWGVSLSNTSLFSCESPIAS